MHDGTLTLDTASTAELIEAAWRSGDLSWKLYPHQLRVYEDYRRWAENPTPSNADGSLDLLYVLRIARRWGKTRLTCLIKVEDCLRNPGSRHTYATRYAKDIGGIVAPLFAAITEDCPADIRPRYHGSSEAEGAGFYFPNGSVLRLAGLDRPETLRGFASDGFAISEAGFVRELESTIRSVIYPQFLGRPAPRMILESSEPEDPNHDFKTFLEDAKTRHAFADKTIDDYDTLDPQEKAKFIRASGGISSATTRREYYNESVRNDSRVVVPEFDERQHVQAVDVPEFADCYVSLDPGVRDLCAILWGFWDFEHARLVIQRDWAERNASIATIAETIRDTEQELWSGLKRWDGRDKKANPYVRVSDVNPLLLQALAREHGIRVTNADKRVGAKAELSSSANVQSLRAAIGRGQIIVDPSCVKLIAHLNSAAWNEGRTDYQRSDAFGHFDLLDALVYMWRAVRRERNAIPPKHVQVVGGTMHVPEHERAPIAYTAQAFDQLFGSKSKVWQRPKNATDPIRRTARRS